jgi:hypothetical protein
LNLFFPFFTASGFAAASFFSHFESAVPAKWEFEPIPDRRQGTNVDVAWTLPNGGTVYCEVKLSEWEFGTARNLPKYKNKLEAIYRNGLRPLVPAEYLEIDTFRAHYQILRNVFLLSSDPKHRLVFLLPERNIRVRRKLERVMQDLRPNARQRVRVVFIETLLQSLVTDKRLSRSLRDHVAAVQAKYVP